MIMMRAVLPKLLKQDAVRLALLNPMRDIGKGIERDFKVTTKTWERQPRWKITRNLNSREGFLRVAVMTDDQQFIWVNEGTRDHWVPRRGTATMVFRRYKAKTRVRVIASQAGGPYGPLIVRTGRWKVKGIKARKFDEVLKRSWQPEFNRRMTEAMIRAARASGHGMR